MKGSDIMEWKVIIYKASDDDYKRELVISTLQELKNIARSYRKRKLIIDYFPLWEQDRAYDIVITIYDDYVE